MDAPPLDDLRFPVGRFRMPSRAEGREREEWIGEIAALPKAMRAAVAKLSPEQLDTPYRPGGWTVRQVVHHVPDSHMNAFTRFKLALTEETPTIKPYDEAAWAELGDVAATPIESSLTLLDALHARWVHLLRSMRDDQWQRGFRHPEQGRVFSLDQALALYAWHSRHHVAHVTRLRERSGWT